MEYVNSYQVAYITSPQSVDIECNKRHTVRRLGSVRFFGVLRRLFATGKPSERRY
jgi:hypothetical protein